MTPRLLTHAPRFDGLSAMADCIAAMALGELPIFHQQFGQSGPGVGGIRVLIDDLFFAVTGASRSYKSRSYLAGPCVCDGSARAAAYTGIRIVKTVPSSALLLAEMVPSCSSTIFFRHRQAQSRTAVAFGRVEKLEHVLHHAGWNSGSVVDHLDDQLVGRFLVMTGDADQSFFAVRLHPGRCSVD